MTRRDPDFTFLAGPAAMSAQTLAALSRPVVTHYGDPDFRGAWRRAETMVAELMRTPGQIVLMGGEAVLGLEAAARALVRPGETRALNLVSGPYGRSMGRWLRELGADVGELSVPWNTAVDPAAVERYLDEHPGTGLLTAVHCETPCGTASDLARIGPAARSRGVLTLADCVSTLGGMPLEAAAWQLDVIVSAPHKCLGGPSGMSLVSVTDQAWAAIESNPAAPRSSYLSLLDWRERWHGKDQFPYTPFAAALAGLAAACEQALDEGLDACIARHAAAARACRAGAAAMGLALWPASDDVTADCVTAIVVPAGLDHQAVRLRMRDRYGVATSPDSGVGNLVRIAHMGPTASGLYPVTGLMALGRALADLGAAVDIGAGIEAALSSVSAADLIPAR